ncbi:MAG TPA: hypothetical protein VLA56_06295 [Pseudomonadales bacterium]|nr:hypothetical protein [Pseudomonadales bacterium]
MNIDRLRLAESEFLHEFPLAFEDPGLAEIGRRHRVERLSELAQARFTKAAFKAPGTVLDDAVRVVGRSSMVSMFEKPRFRDFVAGLDRDARAAFAAALKQLLHGTGGSPRRGFETLVDLLLGEKLAKWSLVTAIPYYVHPVRELFVKPTTAKGIIAAFELEVPPYRPCPDWDFYRAYRQEILAMRALVRPQLAPNNAAFCGFLMMTMKRVVQA